MAAVAARTRRLKFGPSVLVAPFRSSVLAARQLAMLDYLSGGRALPAVGIGVEQEREFRAAGVPFRERGRRTDEAILIMRRCWSENEVSYNGEFCKLERITVLPKPVQQQLPLWIGGNSEAAMRGSDASGGPARNGPETYWPHIFDLKAERGAYCISSPRNHANRARRPGQCGGRVWNSRPA